MKMKKVVIIGTGLIGGSIAKAVLEKGLAEEVVGICRRRTSLKRALKAKALTSGYVDIPEEAVQGADLIVIATPVHAIKESLSKLASVIRDQSVLVTDVGSTKKEIVEYASKFRDKFSFVGSHPLAGSEKTGVEYSRADLFKNSLCVLADGRFTDRVNLKRLAAFWQALGARVETVTDSFHDEALAFTSHLPHVVAYALVGAEKKRYIRFMSTGFKDTTRIAASDPGLWTDIFMSNRANVLASIRKFKKVLGALEKDIKYGKNKNLNKKLLSAKRMREWIV